MRSCDVLVVGCGPVGALLALGLGARGLDVVVVDPATAVHPLPRAVAADDEVAHLLERAAPGALDGAVRDVPVRLLSAAGRELGSVHFPPGPSGDSGLSLFSQPALEARLGAALAAYDSVQVRRGVRLRGFTQDAGGVTARLGGGGPDSVRSTWLVGCDGASSTVRQRCGIGWQGRDLARWLVVDVEGRVDRPGLTYTCDPARPQVDMPTPGGHRWEWLLRAGEPAPAVEQLLARDVDPHAVRVVRAVTYRYGARQAAQWQLGRVLLAGDAAHTMPPFAGQGLGAGVRDAHLLAGLLAGGEASGGAAGEAAGEASGGASGGAAGAIRGGVSGEVSGYQARRSPHVRRMTRLSLLLGAVVETGSPSLAAVRDPLLRSAFRAPGLGPWLRRGGPRNSASGVLDPPPAPHR